MKKELFQKKLDASYNGDIVLISECKNLKEKVTLKCNIGHEYQVTGRYITENINSMSCRECLLTDKFNKLYQYGKSIGYLFNGKYINNRTKIEVKHIECGNSYLVTPDNFVHAGRRCIYCSKKKPKIEDSKFYEFMGKEKPDYEIIGKYCGSLNGSNKFIHKKCGKEFSTSWANFRKTNCPYCSHPHSKKSSDTFKKEFEKYNGERFSLIGTYTTNKTKVEIECKRCGIHKYVIPVDLLSKKKIDNGGYKCSCEKSSRPEKIIAKFLEDRKINFQSEKKFENCLDKKSLPFDFFLDDFNTIIEYDGEQHFLPVYGKEKLKITKKHDTIKNNFCKENEINLIRIKYSDNLSESLNNIIQRLSLGN